MFVFFSNRKKNVYQSWEISYQSDRPCAPENAPPPPIRTTVLLLFPLLRTIPNRSSRHQDTLSLLLTTTPSLPPSPTPLPCTSPTARSTATTVTLDVCSSSTSESRDARGTEMTCKRGHSEVKSREKNKLPWFIVQSIPHLVQQRAFVSLFVSFVSGTCCDSWDVIHRRLANLALIASFDVSPYYIPYKWVTFSWFWLGQLCMKNDLLKKSLQKIMDYNKCSHNSHQMCFRTLENNHLF